VGTRLLTGLAADAERAAVAGRERQELHLAGEPSERRLGRDRAGGGQRPVGHAVIAAAEGEQAAAPGGGLGELPGGLDRIRAARPAELHARAGRQRPRQVVEQLAGQLVLDRGGQVERLQGQALVEGGADRLDDDGMAVAERERAGAGQAVDIAAAVAGDEVDALAADERERQAARVGAGAGLAPGLPPQDAGRAVGRG